MISVNVNNNYVENAERSLVNNNDLYNVSSPEGIITPYDESIQAEANDKSKCVKCYCGKSCKGLGGLQAHQIHCHIRDVSDLNELFASDPEDNNSDIEVEPDLETQQVHDKYEIKHDSNYPKQNMNGKQQTNISRLKLIVQRKSQILNSN